MGKGDFRMMIGLYQIRYEDYLVCYRATVSGQG